MAVFDPICRRHRDADAESAQLALAMGVKRTGERRFRCLHIGSAYAAAPALQYQEIVFGWAGY